MSAHAAFAASFVKLSTLTDGTIRLVLDVEPKDRDAAFAVCDRPGAPVALARLTNDAAIRHDTETTSQPADPLPPLKAPLALASQVALVCQERSFADFLRVRYPNAFASYERSGKAEPIVQCVHNHCEVLSRSEIKPGTDAAKRWADLQADYEHWQRTGEAA